MVRRGNIGTWGAWNKLTQQDFRRQPFLGKIGHLATAEAVEYPVQTEVIVLYPEPEGPVKE
jgi:hypothetical protein